MKDIQEVCEQTQNIVFLLKAEQILAIKREPLIKAGVMIKSTGLELYIETIDENNNLKLLKV